MTITKEGALASFYTVNKAPIKHLRVYFSPKQAGSGTASPENVREISGWNGIEITHTGKNIGYMFVNPNGYLNWSNAAYYNGTSGISTRIVTPHALYGKTVRYSALCDLSEGTDNSSIRLGIWSQDKELKYTRANAGQTAAITAGEIKRLSPSPITLTENTDYYFQPGATRTSNSNGKIGLFQLEFGTESTEFEPYKGQMNTIDWSNDVGIIYGGYIDLITGELVQEWDGVTHTWQDGENQTIDDETKLKKRFRLNYPPISGGANNISNVLNYGYGGTYVYNVSTNNSNGRWAYVTVPTDISTNLEIQLIYKLATPITHQLSPQSLSTFLGRNNIWSNADRIEVEYDLAESNDELYRRRNILLQGAPHLETATGNVANFKTDLIAPIKEAKVYFEPKQLGSGDPSPSNVREIVGQNSIEITQAGLNLVDLTTLPGSYSKTDLTCTIDRNTISLTANLNQNGFGQYTAIWYLPPALLGEEIYIGCTEVVHPESEYFSTVVCEFRNSENTRISDPTVITTKTNLLGKKVQIPANAEKVEFYFRIAQDGRTVGIPQGDTVIYKNFYVRWPAGTGGYEAYNGQIIPITFPAVGKNLLDITQYTSKYSNITINDNALECSDVNGGNATNIRFAQTFGPGTYTLSVKGEGEGYGGIRLLCDSEIANSTWNVYYNAYWIDITDWSQTSGSLTFMLNQSSTLGIVFLTKYGNSGKPAKIYDIQLENGSTTTAYEPYTNTIYRGYVDLTKGEIVQTHFLFQRRVGDMDNNESYPGWKNCSDFKAIANYINNTDNGYGYNLICNVGDRIWYNSKNINPTVFIYLEMKNNMTQTEWKTSYPDLVMKWILPLAVPIHYPLTPQTLKTLKGTNNIWSSANGPVSIKYWTH